MYQQNVCNIFRQKAYRSYMYELSCRELHNKSAVIGNFRTQQADYT
uniref:Uncharacterized protein n=1 Tax=Arundo donax TaxID=35708 RepID=A0A0A9GBS4_ARUDO